MYNILIVVRRNIGICYANFVLTQVGSNANANTRLCFISNLIRHHRLFIHDNIYFI